MKNILSIAILVLTLSQAFSQVEFVTNRKTKSENGVEKKSPYGKFFYLNDVVTYTFTKSNVEYGILEGKYTYDYPVVSIDTIGNKISYNVKDSGDWADVSFTLEGVNMITVSTDISGRYGIVRSVYYKNPVYVVSGEE